MAMPVPKNKLPEHGMPAAVAKQLVEDERQLDSNPRQSAFCVAAAACYRCCYLCCCYRCCCELH